MAAAVTKIADFNHSGVFYARVANTIFMVISARRICIHKLKQAGFVDQAIEQFTGVAGHPEELTGNKESAQLSSGLNWS